MWKTVKLSDICDISIGKTPSRSNPKLWDKEKATSNVWLSIADLTALDGRTISDSKEYVSDAGAALFKCVPKKTLIMSFKLSIGKLAITESELRTNEAIAALPIKDEGVVDRDFLYYYLSSINWDDLAGNVVKVKGKTLNKAKLKEIKVVLPPLAEQQRIVAKLDAAFAEIDKATAAAEKISIQALNVFNQFLAFVEGTKTKLDEIVTIKTGKLDSNAATERGKYPFFTCSREVFAIDTFAFECDAVLLAGNNASGDFNVKHYDGKFNAYQRTYVITVKDTNRLKSRYLYFQLINALASFKRMSVGAGTKFLKLGMIKNLEIPLPNIDMQEEVLSQLEALTEQTELLSGTYRKKYSELKLLKAALLAQELQSEVA